MTTTLLTASVASVMALSTIAPATATDWWLLGRDRGTVNTPRTTCENELTSLLSPARVYEIKKEEGANPYITEDGDKVTVHFTADDGTPVVLTFFKTREPCQKAAADNLAKAAAEAANLDKYR